MVSLENATNKYCLCSSTYTRRHSGSWASYCFFWGGRLHLFGFGWWLCLPLASWTSPRTLFGVALPVSLFKFGTQIWKLPDEPLAPLAASTLLCLCSVFRVASLCFFSSISFWRPSSWPLALLPLYISQRQTGDCWGAKFKNSTLVKEKEKTKIPTSNRHWLGQFWPSVSFATHHRLHDVCFEKSPIGEYQDNPVRAEKEKPNEKNKRWFKLYLGFKLYRIAPGLIWAKDPTAKCCCWGKKIDETISSWGAHGTFICKGSTLAAHLCTGVLYVHRSSLRQQGVPRLVHKFV